MPRADQPARAGSLARAGTVAVGRAPAAAAALAVFVVAAIGLSLHRAPSAPRAGAALERAALRDPAVRATLAGVRPTSVQVSRLDGSLTRVTFLIGGQQVAEAAVTRNGAVRDTYRFAGRPVPFGSPIAYEPAVLVGLAVLFVLLTAVMPLRRLRNLDVAAMVSLLAPVILLQHRYVDASVISAVPGLAYLLARASWRGLTPAGPPMTATPLFDLLTARLDPDVRVRLLRILFGTTALVVAMVGLSSAGAVDVIYAVMEGATKLVHGVLPYGHLPGDVVHGDTYPILSYAAYVPVALIAPVGSTWDSVDVALGVSVGCALLAAAAVRVMARGGTPGPTDTRGLRAALAFLSYPPLLIAVSTGTTDVTLAAMLVWAVALWRRPAASTAVLAVAGWFKLAPFALLPPWLARCRGRELTRGLAAAGLVSAAAIGLVVALGGTGGLGAMLHGVAYQSVRGSLQSAWAALAVPWMQPLAEAATLALVVGAAVRVRAGRARGGPDGAAAIGAAILIALQLSASYWTFLYVVWVVPLLAVSLLVTDGEPVPVSEREPSAVTPGLVPVVV